jgi:4-hydroxy-L-threonine phosphate dehydrogenase PdxA
MKTKPVVGLMLGDVTGIGPEIAAKLLADPATHEQAHVLVVGDSRVLRLGMSDAGVQFPVVMVSSPERGDWTTEAVHLIDLHNVDPVAHKRGAMSPEAGRLAGETLKVMTDWARDGLLDAVCFAPLNKAALNRGGWKYNDEHALFAAWNEHEGYYGEVNEISLFSTFRVTSHPSGSKLHSRSLMRRCVRSARASRASVSPHSTPTLVKTACSVTKKSKLSALPSKNCVPKGSAAKAPFRRTRCS